MQLKYCLNIFVKYCKIFHRNIKILTFWNIFENKYLIVLEILQKDSVEIFRFDTFY